ncbi:hypothetical protein [Lewinella sp. 4G2]|uniref:hypothetical protein n=1 Tax=Lewinella sp. 4G2 TaxID=1803372 RepID=UPI0007B4A40D|nr:hypothetical protein [Lewinella sp. 4G2]OAV44133.1 hypothetical protein A3850_006305 [Lewinella sp. 4G2]
MTGKHTGRILFYLETKGYGYLRLEGTLEEFHFRRKNLRFTEPQAGELVTFSIKALKSGVCADEIERAGLA